MLISITEEVISERRIFRVYAAGILVDLREKHHRFPGLLDPEDYAFTHALGHYLHDNGQNGLLARSARYHDGTNLAAFRPEILSNPRHHSYPAYRLIPGNPAIQIERTNGKVWKNIEV